MYFGFALRRGFARSCHLIASPCILLAVVYGQGVICFRVACGCGVGWWLLYVVCERWWEVQLLCWSRLLGGVVLCGVGVFNPYLRCRGFGVLRCIVLAVINQYTDS